VFLVIGPERLRSDKGRATEHRDGALRSPLSVDRSALRHERGGDRTRTLEILIVDDNPKDSDLLRRALSAWRSLLHVTVVDNGEKALSFVAGRNGYSALPLPDLILLDLELPGKSGIEVLAAIKEDPRLCEIPVVILSSSERREDVQSAYRNHANCYLIKAVDLHEYFANIRALEEFWLSAVRLPSDDSLM